MRSNRVKASLQNIRVAAAHFATNGRGGTAMIFALSFVPAMMMAGLAVDYTRATTYQTMLKSATDAAALAGAAVVYDPNNPGRDLHALRREAVRKAFNANIRSETLSNIDFTMQEISNGVEVTSSARMNNAFGKIFNKNSTDIGATAAAALAANTNYEVVFVLDNTGSMAEANKMPVLKAAMNKFLNKLQAGTSISANVRVGLVPFGHAVRVDPIASRGKFWLRQPSRDLAQWQGCITDRLPNYDVDATTPTTSIPNTLFDAVDNDLNIFPVTPSSSASVPALPFTPANCGQAIIFPLTENFGAMYSAVNAMTPSGTTNLTIGLAWGLQMLTPGEPFNVATPFGSNYTKIMVFLTDGLNTRNRTTSDSAQIDARTRLACSNVKAKGIILYTIGVIDENTELLTSCATTPAKHYYAPSADNIPDLFEMISGDLINVRLIR